MHRHQCLTCNCVKWVPPPRIYEPVCQDAGGRVEQVSLFTIPIELWLISGSYKFRSLPFLTQKFLVFLRDSLLQQPEFQVPGMGQAPWERASQVDGQVALTCCRTKYKCEQVQSTYFSKNLCVGFFLSVSIFIYPSYYTLEMDNEAGLMPGPRDWNDL